MGKTVLFAGAGCSKALGFPIVNEISRLIIDGINKDKLFEKISDPENRLLYSNLLKTLMQKCCPGISCFFELGNSEEPPLITDILSLAEFFLDNNFDIIDWNNIDGMRNMEKSTKLHERITLRDVIILLNAAIIEVIQTKGRMGTKALGPMIDWMKRHNSSMSNPVSVITTNYDYSIEWNLIENDEDKEAPKHFDYGFAWRDIDTGEIHQRPSNPQHKIFKLHGSVDWLKCPRCGFIYVNPVKAIYELPLSNSKNVTTECHCDYWPLETVLVTPSYVREYRDPNILQIWQLALEELRSADEWVIAGFSMPTEDFSVRSLFLRALHGREKWPDIKVIQLGNRDKPKYETFFGEGKFHFDDCGIKDYNYQY